MSRSNSVLPVITVVGTIGAHVSASQEALIGSSAAASNPICCANPAVPSASAVGSISGWSSPDIWGANGSKTSKIPM